MIKELALYKNELYQFNSVFNSLEELFTSIKARHVTV